MTPTIFKSKSHNDLLFKKILGVLLLQKAIHVRDVLQRQAHLCHETNETYTATGGHDKVLSMQSCDMSGPGGICKVHPCTASANLAVQLRAPDSIR